MKATVRLGGVDLAGSGPINWKIITGTAPYTTALTVHRRAWESLQRQVGQPLDLEITDKLGTTARIKEVYILHQLPSDSPHRVSFLVADKRWLWAYKLIVRDYNIPRKTGDRTAAKEMVPVETQTILDKYDFLPYSLNGATKWTAKAAVEDVLKQLDDSDDGGAPFQIESFPIEDGEGQFSLQGVRVRDSGAVALSRLLSYVPGAEVYVNVDGRVTLFDGADLGEAERHFSSLPPSTWAGDWAGIIDRKAIRPSKVIVHYQREVEVVWDYQDDYSEGSQLLNPDRNAPFLENVIPTTDPVTEVLVYDPEKGSSDETASVPSGTWVEFKKLLASMELDRPAGAPWTFATLQRYWVSGDLDGVMGGLDLDNFTQINVSLRIQSIKQHFRQMFRVNRRYMERVRDILAIRVALLDPVLGARAKAAVWGQACIIPSEKGKRIYPRLDPDSLGVFRNVDMLARFTAGARLIDTEPGPAEVNIRDTDLGIFGIEWKLDPYGKTAGYVPSQLVGELTGQPVVPTRNLARQDDLPMGHGIRVEGGTNAVFLDPSVQMKVMMTIIPAAPNNARQFHRVEVEASDVADIFRTDFRIQGGDGPPLEVFVSPNEMTARFGWQDDALAEGTVQNLLGLNSDDDPDAGIEGTDLPGFVLANEERHLTEHARSVAAEVLAPFSDSIQGAVTTRLPENGLTLKGNMASATLRVEGAPSAKVDTVHVFPGQQKPLPRFAVLPDSVRAIVLGVVNRE